MASLSMDDALNGMIRAVQAQQEKLLAALPVDMALCVHQPRFIPAEPTGSPGADHVTFRVQMKAHVLPADQPCTEPGTDVRTRYAWPRCTCNGDWWGGDHVSTCPQGGLHG